MQGIELKRYETQQSHITAQEPTLNKTPSIPALLSALRSCRNRNQIDQGRKLHTLAVEAGLDSNILIATTLLKMYSKCGSLNEARDVFNKMPPHNQDAVAWTSLMLAYSESGHEETSLTIFTAMMQNTTPDAHAFAVAIKAFTSISSRELKKKKNTTTPGKTMIRLELLEKGMALHSAAAARGLELHLFVGTSLVEMYSKSGCMEDSRRVFDRMPARSVVTWTSLILGYSANDDGEEALRMFSEMTEVRPNSLTFVAALKACTTLSAKEQPRKLEHHMMCKPVSLERTYRIHSLAAGIPGALLDDPFLRNTLMDSYSKSGSIADCERVFRETRSPTIVSWNALMLGFVNNGLPEEALELFFTRLSNSESRCELDAHSFVAALAACGSLASLEPGKAIHSELCRKSLDHSSPVVLNSLVDFYSKCGSLTEAELLADSAPEPNVVTLTALLTGFTRRGETHRAFRVFQGIRSQGLHPNGVTFLSLLTSCSHSGMIEAGKKLFEKMLPEFGVEPGIEHHHCLIDLLGRGNRVSEALQAAESMPFEPGEITWLTILSAAKKWKNLGVAELAFEKLLEIDGSQSSGYSLMASLYGSLKMPEEKRRVHEMRKSSGAFKKPGRSWWSDKRGVLHRFAAGDWGDHPQREMIKAKLLELQAEVELEEDDEEEDDGVCEHSERLAIACALVNSEAGDVIRVAKNLRVCEDCHRVIKIISRLEKRVIVCRDVHRFHVFELGKCSCGDFW